MAVYFMRADGESTKAAATSDQSTSTSMSLATFNGSTFSAGDLVWMSDRGGEYRGTLTFPSSGSAGNPFTLRALGYPIINGSDIVTGWTNYSGNVWQATLSTEPKGVWFNDQLGTNAGSLGGVDAALEWWWVSNVLYVYSTADPDTAYTAPGIEAGARQYGVYATGKSYIDVDRIRVRKLGNGTASTLYGFMFNGCSYIHVDRCWAEQIWGTQYEAHGFVFESCSNSRFMSCLANDGNGSGFQTRSLAGGAGTHTDLDVIDCLSFGWDGEAFVTVANATSGGAIETVQHLRCIAHDCGWGFYGCDINGGSGVTDLLYSGCVAFDNTNTGLEIPTWCSPRVDDVTVYNCTFVANGTYGADLYGGGHVIKNTIIAYNDQTVQFRSQNGGGTAAVADYLNIYDDAAFSIIWNSNTRTYAEWVSLDGGNANGGSNSEPGFTNFSNRVLTLGASSPNKNTGVDLGYPHNVNLHEDSEWPGRVYYLDGDKFGDYWDIGAYPYREED